MTLRGLIPNFHIHVSVSDSYIFPRSICLFCCWKYVNRSWEYINRSQIHECGNWDWGRTIPRKGIHKWDFRRSAPFTHHNIHIKYNTDLLTASLFSHCQAVRWICCTANKIRFMYSQKWHYAASFPSQPLLDCALNMLQRVFCSIHSLISNMSCLGILWIIQCNGVHKKLFEEMDHLFLLMPISFSKAVAILYNVHGTVGHRELLLNICLKLYRPR
jgi:hypothetical protein